MGWPWTRAVHHPPTSWAPTPTDLRGRQQPEGATRTTIRAGGSAMAWPMATFRIRAPMIAEPTKRSKLPTLKALGTPAQVLETLGDQTPPRRRSVDGASSDGIGSWAGRGPGQLPGFPWTHHEIRGVREPCERAASHLVDGPTGPGVGWPTFCWTTAVKAALTAGDRCPAPPSCSRGGPYQIEKGGQPDRRPGCGVISTTSTGERTACSSGEDGPDERGRTCWAGPGPAAGWTPGWRTANRTP
jgi:hypothetical protein